MESIKYLDIHYQLHLDFQIKNYTLIQHMNILKRGIAASLVLFYFNANAQADTSKRHQEPAISAGGITEAVFPGGKGAWYRFLSNNINSYIAADKGAKPGSYTVKIEFWIDTTGRVTGIKALTNFGFGMEEELIRVISKSVLWTPAKQGDSLVRERKLQTITFNAGK